MPSVRLPQWRPAIKPPGPTQADWVRANCAWLGLPGPKMFFAPGNTVRDVVGGRLGTLGTNSVPVITGGQQGIYFEAVCQVPVLPLVIGSGPYTLAAVVNPVSLTAARSICSWGTYDPAWVFAATTGKAYVYDGGNKTSATVGVTVGTINRVAAVRNTTDASGAFHWLNGATNGTYTHADSVSLTATINLSSDRTTTTAALYGTLYQLGVWDVALSDTQLAIWDANWPALLAPPQRRVWFDVGGGGGTTYPETVTGAWGLASAQSGVGTFPRTATESISLAGTQSALGTFPRTVTDSLALTDAAASIRAIFGAVTDSLALETVQAGTWTFIGTVTGAVALASVQSALGTLQASLAGSMTLATSVEATGGAGTVSYTITAKLAASPSLTARVH